MVKYLIDNPGQSPEPGLIHQFRSDFYMNAEDIANTLHVSTRTVYLWLSGSVKMPPGLWELLLVKTGVLTPSQLVT